VNIAIVLGSSRPGRLGERVCRMVRRLSSTVEADFTVIDVGGYDLPFFDEPIAPLANPDRQTSAPARRFLDDMAAADGYVFLTPEYNYAPPAVLKNALDFLATEAEGKPALIVSYSSTPHGGTIAGQQLRIVLGKLGMLPLPKSLPLAHADVLLDPEGRFTEESRWITRISTFIPSALDDLANHARVLRQLRKP
jgi:NAD(P)H-dependent FMN reductase